MLRRKGRIFLETTSLRGVGKAIKAQSRFLSRLWALFVFGSSTLLFLSVFRITADYLQYDVNIQTYLDIDDSSPFPAVSICNNQPFSQQAYKLWAADTIQSPTDFNAQLRQQGLKLLNDTKFPELYAKLSKVGADERQRLVKKMASVSMEVLQMSMLMDNSRTYYQNLEPKHSQQLGHSRDEAIVDCIFRYDHNQVQGTRGCRDRMVDVTEFSHPNYFNCMTITFKPGDWEKVLSLTLIIWLGPAENYDFQYRQAFLFDVFEQAYGLRVAIHEPGSPPRVLEQGMQTEPGKMTEVKYHPVKFIRASTPKNPCLTDRVASQHSFQDLSNAYNYDLELCLNSKVQEVILQRCGCMYIELPRIGIPNSSHPYCGRLDEKLHERFKCLRGVDQRQLRKNFEITDCIPKCSDLSFNKELSVTKWRDTQWMLHWIKENSNRWNTHFGNLAKGDTSPQQFKEDLKLVMEYLSRQNVSNVSQESSNSTEAFKFDERYTFLVVKRESNNTLVKKEKIVLTLNALFSRIGGLCSMYMGLSLAFFIECIEFVYSLLCEKRPFRKASDSEKVVELPEAVAFVQEQQQQQQQQQQSSQNPAECTGQTPECKLAKLNDSIWVRQPNQFQI